MTTGVAPSMFISHGAPSFALEDGVHARLLKEAGTAFTDAKAIVVLSPHWQTRSLEVMSHAQPETLMDFYGFDYALQDCQLNAPGDPDLAGQLLMMLRAAEKAATLNAHRGRDHGCWVPMLHLLPRHNIPVLQLSMPHTLDCMDAFALGKALKPLRAQGVALVGSGSLTHNLADCRGESGTTADYVNEFETWTEQSLERAPQALLTPHLHPSFKRAHPSVEHYLPLCFALGASFSRERPQVINGGAKYHALSMLSVLWQTQ